MIRLRQMDTQANDLIYFDVNQTWVGWWAPTMGCSVPSVPATGRAQIVLDDYQPGKYGTKTIRPVYEMKDFHIDQKAVVQKYRSLGKVPPLHAVQMSKIEFIDPRDAVTKYWFAKNSNRRLSARGMNLGVLPLSMPTNTPGCKIPRNPSLIAVDPKMFGYLLQRAYRRMSAPEFDFGTTIGEVAETAAMLAHPLRSVVKLSNLALAGVASLRTNGFQTTLRIARNATKRQERILKAASHKHPIQDTLRIVDESANHWLAYKFGVLPFIEDIKKVFDFKEGNIQRLTGLRVARVRGRKIEDSFFDLAKDSNYNGWYLSYLTSMNRTEQYSCGVYFRNRITAPIVNFVENLGFAPWQLPGLAWELIPLSFVVDRFIDVKSFIHGNIGSLTKETLGNFCTRKIKSVYTCNVHKVMLGDIGTDALIAASQPLVGRVNYDQMARSVNLYERSKFPVINPRWRDELIADATNMSLIWGRLRTHVGKIIGG